MVPKAHTLLVQEFTEDMLDLHFVVFLPQYSCHLFHTLATKRIRWRLRLGRLSVSNLLSARASRKRNFALVFPRPHLFKPYGRQPTQVMTNSTLASRRLR